MSRHIPYRDVPRESASKSLVEKGSSEALKMDTNEIQRTVSILRDNYTVRLDEAPQALTSEINKLNQWALLLWGTETYNDFYKIIMSHFADLDERDIVPGTIAAFCYGCGLNSISSLSDKGARACTPSCLGSIKPSGVPQWVSCTAGVQLLYRDKKGIYRWKELQKAKAVTATREVPTTYIFFFDDLTYLDDSRSGAGPPTTSLGEARSDAFGIGSGKSKPIDYKEIVKRGINKYSLYEYRGGNYRHVRTDASVPVQRLSSTATKLQGRSESDRETLQAHAVRSKRKHARLSGWAIAVVLIAILLIVAIVYFLLKPRGKMHGATSGKGHGTTSGKGHSGTSGVGKGEWSGTMMERSNSLFY